MNIAQYYKDIDILIRMQLGNLAEPFWQRAKVNPQTKPAQTVVYLGCNVLRTLHLAAQFVSIVKLIYDDQRNRKNTADVKNLLQQFEGITVVGGGQITDFGYHCSTNAEQPSQSFLRCIDASINSCETRIDTVVSVYHSCHRALVKAAKRQGIACVNYVDIVAERAGLQVPDRFGHFMELGNEDQIWAEVADYFSPKEEAAARRVIREFFGQAVLV